jgi:tyrosyl-tRNA synthetase
MLPAYDYWQFWRNTDDKDVGRFLRLFTQLPIEKIQELEALEGSDINKAKIILANEATTICHGIDAAKKAEETALQTFIAGGVGEDLPHIQIKRSDIEIGIAAFKIIHMLELADSNQAAKRLIKAGGARINDNKIDDENQIVGLKDINISGVIKFSSGKKKHAIVKVI